MRLFVGLFPPPHVVAALTQAIDERRGALKRVRWTRPEQLHVTVKFLGETPPSRLADVEGVFMAVRAQAFDVDVSGVGGFPDETSARVVWAGIFDASGALNGLAEHLEKSFEGIGFKPEKQVFRPHVTLGRSDVPQRLPPDQTAFGRFRAASMRLMESRLSPSGSVYTMIRECPFQEPA